MSDKISVLMPTYNRAKMVGAAIKSILAQTYHDIELIVYDDGSTDNTYKMLKNKYKKKIQLIGSKENKGCAHARNVLMEAATGKYACWQDSDDWSNIHRIKCQYNVLRKGHSMVMARCMWARDMKATQWTAKPGKAVKKRKTRGGFANASMMFELSKAVQAPLKRSFGGSDADWINKMKKGNDIVRIDKILYYVRNHVNRIGKWKRKPAMNKAWYDRMSQYK